MIELNNGREVLAAFVMPKEPGVTYANGIVLAQRGPMPGNEFIVWSINFNTDYNDAMDKTGWECTSGDYFDTREEAEYMFGLRLRRLCLSDTMRRAVGSTL